MIVRAHGKARMEKRAPTVNNGVNIVIVKACHPRPGASLIGRFEDACPDVLGAKPFTACPSVKTLAFGAGYPFVFGIFVVKNDGNKRAVGEFDDIGKVSAPPV